MFLLKCEHLFIPSNFTLVARPYATSEGTLYLSCGSFFRTDVPSSQDKAATSRTLIDELKNSVHRGLSPLFSLNGEASIMKES